MALIQCSSPPNLFQFDVLDRRRDSMISAPDLDGDGDPDFLLVGFPSAQAFSGRTRAFLGSTSPTVDSYKAAFVGDASGDGVPDIAALSISPGSTSLRVYRHTSFTPVYSLPLPRTPVFGGATPVGPTSDLDQDGEGDIWVRVQSGPSGGDREIELRSCVDGSLIRSLSSPTGGLLFGQAVALLDDLDGDGVGELAISETSPNAAQPPTVGRVYVMSPMTGAVLLEIPAGPGAVSFGERVHTVGDIDGDGRRDLAVVREDTSHRIEIFSAVTGALLTTMSEPDRSTSVTDNLFFGVSAADVGDVDLDLVPDLVVGAPRARCGGQEGGAAYLLSGRTGELLWSSFGFGISRLYGRDVTALGDLDGDGAADWGVMDPEHQLGVNEVRVDGFGFDAGFTVIDWEQPGSGTGTIDNGQDLDTPGLMDPDIRVVPFGQSSHGVAAFDSDPAGPNSQAGAPGLLVERGNLLVIQSDLTQSTPGIYDAPAPSPTGGTVVIQFLRRVVPKSIDLVSLGPAVTARVTVRDTAGRGRTFDVPPGFTSDGVATPIGAVRGLPLDRFADQQGFAAVATVEQDPGFDSTRIDHMEVWMDGPGALDRLVLDDAGPLFTGGLQRVTTIDTLNGALTFNGVGLGDLNGDGRAELALANGGNSSNGAVPSVQIHDGASGALIRELPQLRAAALDATDDAGASTSGARLLITDNRGGSATLGSGVGLAYTYDPIAGTRLTRTEGPAAGAGLGSDACFLGDLDGDGVDDFVAVAKNEPTGGRLRILSGATGAYIRFIEFPIGNSFLPATVLRGDDIDGDGFRDIVTSGPSPNLGTPGYFVRAYSPTTGALLFERTAPTDGLTLSSILGQTEDRNGDGVDDLVGLVQGNPLKVVRISGTNGQTIQEHTATFGLSDVRSMCVPGDMTGDGIDDIAIVGSQPSVRSLWVLSGADLNDVDSYIIEDSSAFSAVYPAGDVDGDGLADVIVTSRFQFEVVKLERSTDEIICRGRPHSAGVGSRLFATGNRSVADDDFTLTVRNLPPTSFVLLLNASSAIPAFGPGSLPIASDGRLCLSPATLARHNNLFSASAGVSIMDVPLGSLPTANVPGFSRPAMVGETRLFQCWFRDVAGPSGSNLSDAIPVTFK